jgi:hypothetical protein
MMRGLSAGLVLAQTHGRIMCVAWPSFQLAFSNPQACPPKSSYFVAPAGGVGTALLDVEAAFELWSFGERSSTSSHGSNPAQHVALLSSERKVVVMHGDGGNATNGIIRPLDFPFELRAEFQALLEAPRETVVHLRVGDPHEPRGRGVFGTVEDSSVATVALSNSLPQSSYVLSDSDEVYHRLCNTFACPVWRALPHSSVFVGPAAHSPMARLAVLQTLADWTAIRFASFVLHTPSAFSESALLFSNATACVLQNMTALMGCLEMYARRRND